MQYSEDEQKAIAGMIDKFIQMSSEEMDFIYQNSRNEIIGCEIAYHAAMDIRQMRERFKAKGVEFFQ